MKRNNESQLKFGIVCVFVVAFLLFPLINTKNSKNVKDIKVTEIQRSELIYELGYKTATQRVLEGNFNTEKMRDSMYKVDSIDFSKFIKNPQWPEWIDKEVSGD